MAAMNTRDALALFLLLASATAPLSATPAEMNKALSTWRQQMTEYKAAVKHAQTPEEKAGIPLPDASRVAAPLWNAIDGKTGKREVRVQPTAEESMKGKKPGTELRDTFEFEEEWAAPAVVWFVNHPDQLAELFKGRQRQLSFYADALLDSLDRQHYADAMVAECIPQLVGNGNARTYNILEKIYARNGDPLARGYAALGMSIMLGNPLVAAEAGSPAVARGKRVYYLKQALTLTPEDAQFGGVPVSDIVLEQTYRMKNLSVGSVPPRITVKDAAGKDILLPTPGKPTLLFFWTPANDMSADMARKLPTLKAKYPELQLAAIAPSPEAEGAQQMLEASGVEETCFDDAEGHAGAAYRVEQVPTAVLLDARCHVLYIGYPDMHLQAALSSCFQGAPQPATGAEGDAPVLQPGSQPAPHQPNDEAPALREMPEF